MALNDNVFCFVKVNCAKTPENRSLGFNINAGQASALLKCKQKINSKLTDTTHSDKAGVTQIN